MNTNKDFIVLTTGKVLQVFLLIFSIKIYTTYLSVIEIGHLYLIQAVVSYFGLSLINPVGMYINRRLHSWKKQNNVVLHLFFYQFYILLVALLSVVIVYLASIYFDLGKSLALNEFILIVFLFVLTNSWNGLVVPTLNLFEQRVKFVVFLVLGLLLALALAFVAIQYYEPTAFYWFIGYLLGLSIVTFFAIIFLYKFLNETDLKKDIMLYRINKSQLLKVMAFSLPLAVATFLLWVQTQSYKILIEQQLGADILGLLGVGLLIASNIGTAYESLFDQVVSPKYYAAINTESSAARVQAWQNLFQMALPIFLSMVFIVAALSPFIMKILANDEYMPFYYVISLGIIFEFFRIMNNIVGLITHTQYTTKRLIKPFFIGAAVLVVMVSVAIQIDEKMWAIPIALAVSSSVILLLSLLFLKSEYQQVIIDYKLLSKMLVLSIPFALAVLFYQYIDSWLVTVSVVISFSSYYLFVLYKIVKQMQTRSYFLG